jgi:hypothetical protein
MYGDQELRVGTVDSLRESKSDERLKEPLPRFTSRPHGRGFRTMLNVLSRWKGHDECLDSKDTPRPQEVSVCLWWRQKDAQDEDCRDHGERVAIDAQLIESIGGDPS